MIYLRIIGFAWLFLFTPLVGLAEICPISLQVTYADGVKGCLTDLSLSNSIDKSWGKPISEVVRSAPFYAIAASDICEEIRVGVSNLNQNTMKETAERNALSGCSNNCDCKVIISNGNALITKSTGSLYGDTVDLKKVLG